MVTLAVLPGKARASLVVAKLANPGNSSGAINLLVPQSGIVGLGGGRWLGMNRTLKWLEVRHRLARITPVGDRHGACRAVSSDWRPRSPPGGRARSPATGQRRGPDQYQGAGAQPRRIDVPEGP